MLITERLPLTGANLIFCERTRDRINSDPRRRAGIVMDSYADVLYVADHASPVMEKNLHKGKRILGWRTPERWALDGGSGEA